MRDSLRIFRDLLAAGLRLGGVVLGLSLSLPVKAGDVGRWAAEPPPPPAGALGYPSRAADLDVLPGFRAPPPGYGEVPFWWWTGDPLDRERLRWQIEELHRQGIAGVQVNYAHEDTPGWPTYAAEPPIFSDAWWEMWAFVAGECGRRDMGIGLSGYTLDWPNGRSLVSRTIYSDPDIGGRELQVASRTRVSAGTACGVVLPAGTIGVRAYPVKSGRIDPRGRTLEVAAGAGAGRLEWTPAEGEWEVWVYASVPKEGALNPVHPESGRRVIEKFFQRFQDHAPGRSAKGLNYFFHDELQFGVGDHVWGPDFAEQFRARKGYDVFEALPGLFADLGPRTAKARLDYLDVRMELIQERYFAPIFEWHWSRGLIYGCDQGSRGRDPMEFGDYFGAVRWYTAPGHDTPGGHADLIKGKVSSSIAHLYRRPRVWLEGYHSLGWGAAPERLMQATCENYLYGCNLLNLHGLYYSTHGSHWEWAPPCYHFRMPYWDHMGVFLKYFERLSYLLSQGVHQAEIAVLYPVTPGRAGLGGKEAADTAFEVGTRLFEGGRDFVFLDDDSLARARIEGGRLHVADAAYRVLVLPAMRAVRWPTLTKAEAFAAAGGRVIAVGALPEASERAGAEDPELDGKVRALFGVTAVEAKAEPKFRRQAGADGWRSASIPAGDRVGAWLAEALGDLPLDVTGARGTKAMHRRVGPRDVYFVLGAPKGSSATFRASGRVELWDPWSGEARPLPAAVPVPGGTRVRLPLGPAEAQVIVFSPGAPEFTVAETDLDEVTAIEARGGRVVVTGYADAPGPKKAVVGWNDRRIEVAGRASAGTTVALEGEWEFELRPTLNNRWGDFRLPVTEPLLGPEGRIFRYAEERAPQPGFEEPGLDDSGWARVTHGFGPKFWKLGPFPADADLGAVEEALAERGAADAGRPVEVGGKVYAWERYDFSWRWGREGDPGHQGWHGLKENVSPDFLCLGRPTGGHNETVYREEPGGTRYFLRTSAFVEGPTPVRVRAGGLLPASVRLNGELVPAGVTNLDLVAGANDLLLRYDGPGRGHFVLQRRDAGAGGAAARARTPLAMPWHDEPGLIPFDVRPGERSPVGWYRFVAPPGLRALTIVARGEVEVWADGVACRVVKQAHAHPAAGVPVVRAELPAPVRGAARVALRIRQERGAYGGEAIPEAIQLECGVGTRGVGDWAVGSALENYSGGAWYRKTVNLEASQLGGRVLLDLGAVVATAEVRVNGETVGIRVAPPWVVDIGRQAKAGANRIEVLVYNTLANHYLTIPTKYRGDLRSGLLGPVRLEIRPRTVLE